jgi:hypothetical protein
MSKTFIVVVVVGNAIAAVSATWPLGIPSATPPGFLSATRSPKTRLLRRPAPAAGRLPRLP